jgi:hypothetical protein
VGEPFVRDPSHWLACRSPAEWVRAGLAELGRAKAAYAAHDGRAALTSARRAAGMALNGALLIEPAPAWGRTYMEHLGAVAVDASLPRDVSDAARLLLETPPPGGAVILLRSPASDERILEAARTVMAHAYARIVRAGDVLPHPAPHPPDPTMPSPSRRERGSS